MHGPMQGAMHGTCQMQCSVSGPHVRAAHAAWRRNTRPDTWRNRFPPHHPQMCTPHRLPEGLCTDRRLYVHAVCRAGQHLKREAFEKLGLWFVHVNPDDPLDIRVNLPAGDQLPCGNTTWALDY